MEENAFESTSHRSNFFCQPNSGGGDEHIRKSYGMGIPIHHPTLCSMRFCNRQATLPAVTLACFVLVASRGSFGHVVGFPSYHPTSASARVVKYREVLATVEPNNQTSRPLRRKSRATSCETSIEKIVKHSKSQDLEDQYLFNSFFRGLCGGTYVELGGLDGVHLSNSHLFHYGLGWNGVLVEPNPKSFTVLQKNRPHDDTYNFAVCSEASEVTFIDSGAGEVTGILEFMAPSFLKQWHPNGAQQTSIRCEPLRSILKDSSLDLTNTAIDFLSLDVEGAEFEVLKTIDFDEVEFGVVFYEADEHNPVKNQAIMMLLEAHGYAFRAHTLRSNFHVNVNWHNIYRDFL